jgi:hypothetical protein
MAGQQTLTGSITRHWRLCIGGAVAFLGLAFGLAWVSNGYSGGEGWASFLAFLVLGGLLLWGGWRALRSEALPTWLAGLLVGAALLRLAAGVLWMVVLPVAGHQSETERQGYVMADAYERDQAAWDLARSEKPLSKAFEGGYHKADQYGGLLYLSAFLYRFLGGMVHQPLQMVVLAAAFSALAVGFTWAFARRAWGEQAARLAAWGMALYPEAVLLGSSQMREAFTLTFAMAAFYGLVCFHRHNTRSGLAWMIAALALCLPFSPPLAALLLVALALTALAAGDVIPAGARVYRYRFWLVLGGLAILAAAGVWLTQRQLAPQGVHNLFELVRWWIKETARFQAYLSERASGWMQKVFASTPAGVHLLLLLLYGIVQPFLPAALVATSQAPAWRWIVLWRSLGWTALLPLLLYAPVLAWRRGRRANLAPAVSLVVWLGILVASLRGGGDLWDNPRYRATFAGLQVALAAWAWVEQRRQPDPWLRRSLVGVGLVLAWFLPWYLRRYTLFAWPVDDLFKTLGLGLASAVLYWIWDWARENKSVSTSQK